MLITQVSGKARDANNNNLVFIVISHLVTRACGTVILLAREPVCRTGGCFIGRMPVSTWELGSFEISRCEIARRLGVKVEPPSLLTGIIGDGEGNKLTASHTVKSGRRYRYYCQAVTQQGPAQGSSLRLPAFEIEGRVVARIAEFLQSENEVMDQLGMTEETTDYSRISAQSEPKFCANARIPR
jgi:hypothetical protein